MAMISSFQEREAAKEHRMRGAVYALWRWLCERSRSQHQGYNDDGLRYLAAATRYSLGHIREAKEALKALGLLGEHYTGCRGWRTKSRLELLRPAYDLAVRARALVDKASKALACSVYPKTDYRKKNKEEGNVEIATYRLRSDGNAWTDEAWKRRCFMLGKSY